MTPVLTDERKAAIKDMVQGAPGLWKRADLSKIKIDPAIPDQFLTEEMIGEILSKPVPADLPEITSDRVDTDAVGKPGLDLVTKASG